MIALRIHMARSWRSYYKEKRGQVESAIKTALHWAMNDAVTHARTEGFAGPPDNLTSRSGMAGLKGSIGYRLEEKGSALIGIIYAQKIYARIHEKGGTTKAHVIRPRHKKALAFFAGGEGLVRKSVNHPGSKIPARPYLQPALEHAADKMPGYFGPALKRELAA